MKKFLSVFLIIILSISILSNCKKDKEVAPVLPPQGSMTIDFSNFGTQKKSGDIIFGQKGTENSNWEFAATVAGIWKMILSTTLIVPVTAFKLAVNQEPAYLSDQTWQWSYNVSVAEATYKARLTGQVRTSDIVWKMYITKEGTDSFTEFLWFEGTSKPDGSSGTWTLNQSPTVQTALLEIEWTKTGSSVGKIVYTYLKNDSFKDSYIEYGLTTNDLNAYYAIYYYDSTKLDFSTVDVEWNTTTKNGRVKCLDYLGDDLWHYWNANYVNI